ncbi:MAG: hypothetical protein K9J37_15685 [Saprospiraceae bacterium]|nr:hypothetical protein [Saprospiraceae bacterium]MCF8251353.1 hypothetical protein [Saprospiraceae bacterium]MCF8441701.1 hypothetical protein [Saprospiraceae bacterium]
MSEPKSSKIPLSLLKIVSNMVVTIQFQTPEDFKWIEPLMKLLKQSNIKVNFKGNPSSKQSVGKPSPKKVTDTPITEQLQGVIKLPADFDYKSFMGDELQKTYLANG